MYAFSKADDVFNIYYEGSNEEWQTINIITEGNYALSRAIVCFYSENDPVDTTYQYWHYVDGVPTLW
jgi:hypothetical protein